MSKKPEKRSSDGEEGLQHAAEHAKPGKKNPVLLYLVILFAAAFVLLLMSYRMQQRANQVAMENLQQTSNSATQSLENLITERDALSEQVDEMQTQLDDLQDQLKSAQADKKTLEQKSEELSRQLKAMEYFWQIDDYYARGYYTQAKALIVTVEEQGLQTALPSENTTGTDRFSPAQRYQEIRDALIA